MQATEFRCAECALKRVLGASTLPCPGKESGPPYGASLTRHLTAIRGSDSLFVARRNREGFRAETLRGPFLCLDPFLVQLVGITCPRGA